jgi:hypothetical protein
MTISVVIRRSYNNCGLTAGMRWKSGCEAVYSSLSFGKMYLKVYCFVGLFVVFHYEMYGRETGAVLIQVF